jgi:hypothetical protein
MRTSPTSKPSVPNLEDSDPVQTDVDRAGGETVTPTPPPPPTEPPTKGLPGGTAFTGPSTAMLAGLAVLLLSLGAAQLRIGRRRSRASER